MFGFHWHKVLYLRSSEKNAKHWCLGSLFLLLRLPSASTQREGFFNKTSYIRLFTPLSLNRHIGLSFRTCEGGQLFQQTSNGNSITLEVRQDGLQFAVSIPPRHFESRISANFLDNNWHTVNILHRLGNLTLAAEGHQVVVANLTYNYDILAQPELFTEKAVLMVGNGFVGCILEGPSIVFNNSQIQPYNVEWGPCPLAASSCSKVDHCSHEPCMMHGVCVSRPDRYVCHCAARYSGNNCEIDNGSPCQHNPCKNGGICKEDIVGDFTCHCPYGFTGQFCETEVTSRLCENNPCYNNGTCHISAGGSRYECTCLPGYTGKDCEININECQSSPCQHGGTCMDGIDSYTCFCGRTGYTGTNCELNINECDNNPCLNRGICFDTYGSYTCQCTSGFGGQNCELNLNECSSGPCLNGGRCEDSVGSYTCHCHPGFSGMNCEKDVNECDATSCPPNSECIDKLNKHVCVCKPGYAGNPPNCTEADSCSSAPCLHGGSCLPHVDGFNCSCPLGFTGALCENLVDYCTSSPCRNGGTCESDISSYICDCDLRYTGPRCETLVKCSSNPCQHSTSCQDYPGGYYCVCEPGWTGVNCDLDINECQSDPCRHGGTCKDSLSGFYCECLPGYTGKMCQVNIDECVSTPCLNGGTCIDGINSFKCNCTEDYMGATCEHEYDACLMKPCYNNGTCVSKSSKKDYYCECLPGFEGTRCENNINDCLRSTCPEDKVCVDGVNEYECRCPSGYSGENCTLAVDHCAVNPCLHNGTCKETSGNYSCTCSPGYTGKHCENDVDECVLNKNICNNGICLNNVGSFECFCRPGFSGDHCDLDFDECLSHPCYNSATCENKINGFNCICTPGYTGQDCSININECESNPCMNGSTCIDDIATFSCACPVGLTGRLCETNIDDCESSPCQNGGTCEDGINSYTCNCSDTGYEGIHCESNIDDCKGGPCTNGAVCKDLIKDYECLCYVGYTGKNCDIDINECDPNPCKYGGACLERSNQSYYESNDSSAVLPEIFKQPFSYDTASGYECVCVPGIIGQNCEININECESSPCRSGLCQDEVGAYTCVCDEGFEGVHCEIDINECLRYTPCVHGTCRDQRGPGYICDCPPLFGGMNCSVELTGCKENKCLNGGTCKPYLENETIHRYNCTCPNGFYGVSCEQLTTMSLNGNSYVITNTSREEGYDIHFSFKTTLPNGLLAIGKGSTFYILELVDGRLNLHSSLLNKWEGVFIGSQLNNSNWQKVFVAINASHLVLAANEEQTIYPINLNEGATASHTSFPTTYLGGTIPYLRRLTHGPPSFIGCTQDVYINGQWVLPENSEGARVSLENVEVGCPREPKCDPNPCHSGGHCTDLWRDFRCTCERPFLGHTCQYNLTAATFGYENITASLVTVKVTQQARRAVRNIVDISMFIRTRKSSGGIFYLGSVPGAVPYSDETYIAAQLSGGELQVRIQFNGTPESYTVGGVKIDDGYNHLIQVVRNVTLVQVKINGTEYFRKTISASGQLDFQVLYLGGMPDRPNRFSRQVSRSLVTDFAASPVASFKGVIQDVQISNGSQTMVVQFYPLDVKDLQLPPSVGEVSFDQSTVLEGVVSDNTCRDEPCNNEGICEVTWNDFTCQCPRGYKGKQCDDMEFCEIQKCPKGSECRNLNHGYECVTNITLPGTSAPLQYTYIQGDQSAPLDAITITYRSKTGGLLLYISQDTDGIHNYFSVSAYKDQVTVSWKLTPESPAEVMRLQKEFPNNEWTTISLKIIENIISGQLSSSNTEESMQMFTPANFSFVDFQQLFPLATITVGGSEGLSEKHSYVTDGSDGNDVGLTTQDLNVPSSQGIVAYKGCIGEVRIGGILLPYFTTQQLEIRDNNSARDYFELTAELGPDIELYCVLCFEDECRHGGRCENTTTSYKCECTPGYAGDDCSENINECFNNECKNNATCVDGLANYTCSCEPGWEGWLCNVEIDECLSNPCQNNGTCIDHLGYYECKCTEDYVGDNCEQLRQVTCENKPCKHEAVCNDVKNVETGDNFTCICTEGFVGVVCDTAYCNVKPCLNNGRCGFYLLPPQCLCLAGYRGNHCEENINECESQPCKNNGKCIDGVDSYNCNCSGTGFSGFNCENDVDECDTQSNICGPKGKCINTIGSYICKCEENMCGPTCNFVNPCKTDTPCENNGVCEVDCKNKSDYFCHCQGGYSGKNCTESSLVSASNVADIALIVGPVIAILLIAGGASLAVFLMMARKKRATRGTYSPSSQEYCNPRVELDNVMKPPPEERLI